jgi:leader peptidase (prepilin peptidase)/N-methyltransferase
LFQKEALGGGDKYLLAMIGVFLGYRPLLGVITLASAQGAVVGIALIALRGRAGPAPKPESKAPDDDWEPGATNIPFGPWLAVGAMEVLLAGPHLSGWVPGGMGWALFGG